MAFGKNETVSEEEAGQRNCHGGKERDGGQMGAGRRGRGSSIARDGRGILRDPSRSANVGRVVAVARSGGGHSVAVPAVKVHA